MADAKGIRAGRAAIELSMSGSKVVDKQLRALQARAAAIGSTFRNIGTRMLAAGGAISGAFVLPIKAASDMNESLNKFSAVFGAEATAAGDFADDLAKRVGRSATEIKDSMSSYQAMFRGMGMGATEARKMSEQLAELAVDLGSFHNLSDAEANSRFMSALSGSTEVLEKFGVITKEAAMNQALLDMGINKTNAQASEQEKLLARVFLIRKALSEQGAVGDATTTAGSFGNQLKRLQAALKDTMATVGSAVLPTVTKFIQKLNTGAGIVAAFAAQNANLIRSVAMIGVGLVAGGAAFVALGLTFTTISVAAGGLASGIGLIGTALGALLSPIGLTVAAVGGAVAAFATLTHTGRTMVANLAGWFANLAGIVQQTIGGIVKALGAGDFALAGQVAMAGLNLAWLQGTRALREKWNDFKLAFMQTTLDIVYGAMGWWKTFVANLQKLWSHATTAAKAAGERIGHYLSRSSDPELAAEQDAAHRMSLTNIANEGKAARAEIDKQRDAELSALAEQHAQALNNQNELAAAEEKAAKARLDAAREELRLALGLADARAAEAARVKVEALEAIARVDVDGVPVVHARAQQAMGTFDTRMAQQIFGGRDNDTRTMVRHLANIDRAVNRRRDGAQPAGFPVGA